ncbi:MAG TPA: CDP-glucose 4,6-dehydratase [Solirubrobacteraceae bacterium]|nr:CDP-glucose 4,6-dehydratase [Solirubrobacteraceae bacterium]
MSGFWDGRRVLVTGHTGFKGAWLTLWLHALGARVTGFSGPPPTAPSLFELARVAELCDDLRGDVRDADAVARAAAGAEVVFHLAAQPIVRAALEDPAGTFSTNVVGTAHVLGAARDAAVVCVTSDKCYAPGPGPHREGDPLGGGEPYAASKAAQEHVAASYREALGVRVATARAGNVIGGGDWGRDRLLPDLVRASERGTPVTLRHPGAVRPWQHVLDPLAGYLRLAERLFESSGYAEAWNFGPDGAETVAWVVDQVRARWPLTVDVSEGHAVEAPPLRLDASKARERLGWQPRLTLPEALAATVFWHDEVRAGAPARTVTLTQIEEAT